MDMVTQHHRETQQTMGNAELNNPSRSTTQLRDEQFDTSKAGEDANNSGVLPDIIAQVPLSMRKSQEINRGTEESEVHVETNVI